MAAPAPAASPAAPAAARPGSTAEAEAALRAFETEKVVEPEGPGFLELHLLAPLRGFFRGFLIIRDVPTWVGRAFMAFLCIGLVFLAWWLATRPWWGPLGEERAISPINLGSPEEVFGSFPSLWFERAFMRNLLASLLRVIEGFGLAVAIGVPVGILGGTFLRIDAFFMPISVFGRNVPIAALVPLTLLFFDMGEGQKVAFIFIACVAFIMFDASRAVRDVGQDYLDTAYTLGASRWQVLRKVIVPLALPDIFNSIRLLFGLAFGYIVLAEMINAERGIGMLITLSEKRGPREHVYLILLIITVVAFLFDRVLWRLQKMLFPYRYGSR